MHNMHTQTPTSRRQPGCTPRPAGQRHSATGPVSGAAAGATRFVSRQAATCVCTPVDPRRLTAGAGTHHADSGLHTGAPERSRRVALARPPTSGLCKPNRARVQVLCKGGRGGWRPRSGRGYAAPVAIRWSPIHALLGEPSRDLDFAMIKEAVGQQLRETESLDWKGALPAKDKPAGGGSQGSGRPKDHREEFAKDVAAMANTRGGLIIYGVEETRGTGAAKCFTADPLDNSEPEQRRLRAIAFERIRPIVAGLEFLPLSSDDGQHTVLVLSIPRSPDAPHVIGQKNQLGVPYRDGAETMWMREWEIERAYRERFRNREDERRLLDQLIAELADQLDMDDGKAWIVASARPQTPLTAIGTPLSAADVRSGFEAVDRRTREVVPSGSVGRHMLLDQLGDSRLNPRVGLRRWVMRTTSNLEPSDPSNYVHVELHHDGSVSFAVTLAWPPSQLPDQVHQVFTPLVESFATDFVALAETHGVRTGVQTPMSYQVELRRPDDLPYAAADHGRYPGGVFTNEIETVRGSRYVRRFTPVMGQVPVSGDLSALQDAARTVASEVLHQFGVDRLLLLG